MDYRQLIRFLAAGRVAIGGALVAAPRKAGGNWIGDAAASRDVMVFTRALGIRDLVLGVGTLQAMGAGDPVRPWVVLGAACDAVDAAATLLAVRRIGLRRALPAIAIAGTAAAIWISSAERVD